MWKHWWKSYKWFIELLKKILRIHNCQTGNGRTLLMSKCAECGSKNQDLLRIENFWIIKQVSIKTP